MMLYPLVVFPYITRVLGVGGIGEYSYYNSIIGYMALFSNFGISIVGVREIGKVKNSREEYSKVFFNLAFASLFFTFLSYLILFSISYFGGILPNKKLLLATGMLLLSTSLGCEWFFVGLEKQKFLLIRNFLIKVVCVILIFVYVKNESHLLRYAFIMMLSYLVLPITNSHFYFSSIDWKAFSFKVLNLRRIIKLLFGVFVIDVLIHYYGTMDVFIMGSLSSSESVGYYSTAQKIYLIAYSLLAATAIPLLPRVSFYLKNNDMSSYNHIIQRCYGIYVLVGVFVSFFIILYAKFIIYIIGGLSFLPAIAPLSIFALSISFSAMCNFFVFQIFLPYGKTKQVVASYLSGLVVNILMNILLVYYYSYTGAAVSFFVSYIVSFGLLFCLGKDIIPRYNKIREDLVLLVPVLLILGIHLFYNNVITYYNFWFFGLFDVVVFCLILLILRHHTILYFYNLLKSVIVK